VGTGSTAGYNTDEMSAAAAAAAEQRRQEELQRQRQEALRRMQAEAARKAIADEQQRARQAEEIRAAAAAAGAKQAAAPPDPAAQARKDRQKQALRDALLTFSERLAGADPRAGFGAMLAQGVVGGVGGYFSSVEAQKEAEKKAEEEREQEEREDLGWEWRKEEHELTIAERDERKKREAQEATDSDAKKASLQTQRDWLVANGEPDAGLWSAERIRKEYEERTDRRAAAEAERKRREEEDDDRWETESRNRERTRFNERNDDEKPPAERELTPYQRAQLDYKERNDRFQDAIRQWKAANDGRPASERTPPPRREDYFPAAAVDSEQWARRRAAQSGAPAPTPLRSAPTVEAKAAAAARAPEKTTRATAPEAFLSAAKVKGGGALSDGQRAVAKAEIARLRAQGKSDAEITRLLAEFLE
jgi:hypothetical protein